jgi:AGZA family xanthine/uracil permease-like MFS transporter
VQGDRWRRNGHAEFVDEDEGAEKGIEEELVEIQAK